MSQKYLTLIICVLLTLISCNKGGYSHYIDSDNPNREKLEELFPLLDRQQEHSENRFTIMSEIIAMMLKQRSIGKLNLLITTYINENPDDPYNSYYLLLLSSAYIKNEKNDFAKQYLHRIIKNYPDLDINGLSTHYSALTTLAKISTNPVNRVTYYKTLIKDHKEKVETRKMFSGGIGELYYYLGKAYEDSEMWNESIKAFEEFLTYDDAAIPQEPEAKAIIARKIGFHYSNKKWIVNDLDILVKRIKYAIYKKNPTLLDRYRAHDFFIINWKSKNSDSETSFPMKSSVLTNMNIRAYRDLDEMSNENEAYLAVEGNRWRSIMWATYPKWYFYFKRVNYPMDPNIHGGWEWAGIYLGEKL